MSASVTALASFYEVLSLFRQGFFRFNSDSQLPLSSWPDVVSNSFFYDEVSRIVTPIRVSSIPVVVGLAGQKLNETFYYYFAVQVITLIGS